ncbi:MAG: HAD family phosphatase [Erysipelotrichaceae bacterium]|nr:HAD family phosphatase [Erysipelotrichaceae bacterium]
MKKEIKLIICDIDGTLVNVDKKMMPITKKVFEKLHEQGVLLGIASGRPCGEHLASRAKGWGFDFQFDVIIGMNGGQMWDVINDKHHEYYPLKKEYIKEIIEFMNPTGINSYVYRGDSTLVRWYDERMYASSIRNMEPMVVAQSDEEMWEKDNNKLLFRCKDIEEADYAMTVAADHPSEHYQFFKTAPIMVEFQDPRINKGVALKAFCKIHNIDLDCVAAFGDAQNDDEMIKTAGMGVAMLNAGTSTMNAADYISEYDYNNDGVGRFIQTHILGEEN